ncbi:phage/plasmid primase, P4 family [Oceanobacillus chungangensis]|uniref:SF3 helicase domain-containing protein n=1 Tax=Oceanobacillus chungangensis TaxID=1229152 RepID=A0A3D8PL45_9BACI|nr:phage/plasmid primase, P4 family [Oceanobacillus chungangensis]RDW15958.1 hypothetical protein CWR45_15800 [Oceanobacillus chungangensis]
MQTLIKSQIPQELMGRNQWVLWKLVDVIDKETGEKVIDGKTGRIKQTKVPFQLNGKKAASTDPSTWTSYDNVLNAVDNRQYSGIGYVLTKNDPYTVVDIDDCIIDGKTAPEAITIVQALNSYTEYSQSGNGIHIFVKGEKPGNRSKNPEKGIEIYSKSRFIVMTGNHVKGTPSVIEDRQNEINKMYSHYFPEKVNDKKPVSISEEMEDDEIISVILNSKKEDYKEKFKALYSGDWAPYYESQSEADQALCNYIAFYTQSFPQIDRIFSNSGLYRDKWQRNDYKTSTINNAIHGLNATFQNNKFQLHVKDGEETIEVDSSQFYYENTFLHHNFACYLVKEWNIICLDERLHIYENGKYVANDTYIKRLIVTIIPNLTVSKVREVMERLKLVSPQKEHSDPRYIGVKNGVYDIEENRLLNHSPEFVITNQINANYNPSARCSHIDDMLTLISDNDNEVMHLIKEMIGYTFYRKNVFEKAFLFKGEGGNGKSTLFAAISALLGEENITALSLSDLSERFNTGMLNGKLANIGDDIPYTSIRDTSSFKKLATGNTIKGEFKGETPFYFRSFAKLIFATNKIPRVYDNSQGLKDRLVIIPLNARIRNSKKQDPFFENKITTEEAKSYLLNVGLAALNGLLLRGKFVKPKAVQRMLNEFEITNNPVTEWLHEYYEDGKDIHYLPVASVYGDYEHFCLQNNYKYPLSKKALAVELSQHGYTTDRKYLDGKQVRVYLRNEEDLKKFQQEQSKLA